MSRPYKAIDLARLLMRHGADVYAVMSESSTSTLIKADIMKWATGNEVVTKLTGKLEHIALADTVCQISFLFTHALLIQ